MSLTYYIRNLTLPVLLLIFMALLAVPSSFDAQPHIAVATTATQNPHLYFTPEKIEFLKSRIHQEPYQTFWKSVQKSANNGVKTEPPLAIDPENDNMIKNLAKPLPDMALAYLLTGKSKYLNASTKWMDAFVAYPNWANNEDVEAAEVLFSMSVAYDWLFENLTPVQREQYRSKIIIQANILHRVLVNQEKWWTKDLLQNHNYTNVMAIAVAGFAIGDAEPQAQAWIAAARENFERVLEVLPPDGASHEGVGYWSGGMNSLLRYFKAEQSMDYIQNIPSHPYFSKAPMFRLYTALPDYKDIADYADSPRFDYQGPGFLLRALAAIFQDGRAQWLANAVEKARGKNAEYSWKDLAWYDENISALPPADLPSYNFFDNLGLFVGRSDWNTDAFWFLFKAGPPQGHLAESKQIYTGSHIHPDEGHFALWARGKWFVVDDGYVLKKRTENHNVLTFNGVGQLGDGEQWFNAEEVRKAGGTARIIYKDLQKNYQYLVADLTKIYKPEANLKNWKRTFVALQGKHVVIKDEVTLTAPGTIQGSVHFPEYPTTPFENTLCLNGDGSAAMRYFLPHGGDVTLSHYAIPKKERKKYGNYVGTLAQLNANVENTYTSFMIFSSQDESCTKQYTIKTLRDGRVLKFKDGDKTFVIDFQKQKVTIRHNSR